MAAVGWTMWAVAPRQMEQCPLPSSPPALSTCAANEVLTIVDQNVSAFGQLADIFVEDGMAGLVIGGVDDHFVLGLETEAEASLGMVEPRGVHHAIIERELALFDIVEIPVRLHGAHVDREIGIHHLLFQRALQSATAAGGVEEKIIVRVVVERPEEWNTLNVVPMEM